jgi:hypothetical protein
MSSDILNNSKLIGYFYLTSMIHQENEQINKINK